MSNHSGAAGKSFRASSLTANQMKRQRSSEWQKERNYASSSEEENDRINGSRMGNEAIIIQRKNSSNPSPSKDSSVLAQLIQQSQQLSSEIPLLIFNIKTDVLHDVLKTISILRNAITVFYSNTIFPFPRLESQDERFRFLHS